MSQEKININGVEYVPADSVNTVPTVKQIVILQRGWVLIGDFSQEGNQCTLKNSFVIRKWGTTKGIGQLALEGPTSESVIDECGTCRFHELNIVSRMDVLTPEKWNG